jgi:hypothetical protein
VEESTTRPRTWMRGAAVFTGEASLYAAVALVALIRLLPVFKSQLPGDWRDPDTAMGLWFPWHVARQVAAGANPFFAPELGWPDGLDLTLMLWNLGCQIVALPITLFFSPILAFNLSIVLFSTLNGLAFHKLGRQVGGSTAAGLAAGILGSLAPYALYELCSGRPEQGFLAPLVLALLYFRKAASPGARLRDGVLLGVWTGLSGACYWFHPYLLALCVAPWLLVRLVRRRLGRSNLLAIGLGVAIAVIVALPFALPVIRELAAPSSTYSRSLTGLYAKESARNTRMFQAMSWTAFAWPFLDLKMRNTTYAAPFCFTLLPLAALLPRRSRAVAGFFVMLAAAGIVFALGPVLMARPGLPIEVGHHTLALPFRLLDYLPGFERFWWPRRFQAFAVVGAVGSAAALVACANTARGRALIAAVLVLLGAGELFMLGSRSMTAAGGGRVHRVDQPALYARLGGEPWSQPVLRLPMMIPPNNDIVGQITSLQPLFGGLAQSNPDLAPESIRQRMEDPCIQRLKQSEKLYGARPTSCTDIPDGLRQLGLRWVIWRDDEQPGSHPPVSGEPEGGTLQYGELKAIFGPPTWRETDLAAWDLLALSVPAGTEPTP